MLFEAALFEVDAAKREKAILDKYVELACKSMGILATSESIREVTVESREGECHCDGLATACKQEGATLWRRSGSPGN